MSGHHPRGSMPHRPPTQTAIWGAAVALIVLAVAACSSTSTTTPSTAASAAAVVSTGPGGQRPTIAGAGSTFDAPFFSAAFASTSSSTRA